MTQPQTIQEHFKANYPNAFCLVDGRVYFTKEEYLHAMRLRKQTERRVSDQMDRELEDSLRYPQTYRG